MPTNTTQEERPSEVPEHRRLYQSLWFLGLAILAITLEVALLTWKTRLLESFGLTFDGGPTFLLFAFASLAFSLKMVAANNLAGAFCYGKALKRLDSGLHFVPFGLMQIERRDRTVQEFQCPGEPEEVFKGQDSEILPEGKVRPIRVVTRAPKEDEKETLDAQMTIVVNFVIQYAIKDIFLFISNYGSTDQIKRQLRDVGEIVVVEQAASRTVAGFIKDLKLINHELAQGIENRFQNSGIDIISVRLISPDITHDVSKALAGIPEMRAKAEQRVISAGAQQTELEKAGAGKASAEQALLTARAVGLKKIRTDLEVSGDSVLAAGAVRDISPNTDVILVGAESGMRDLMGLVKGAEAALKTGKGTKS